MFSVSCSARRLVTARCGRLPAAATSVTAYCWPFSSAASCSSSAVPPLAAGASSMTGQPFGLLCLLPCFRLSLADLDPQPIHGASEHRRALTGPVHAVADGVQVAVPAAPDPPLRAVPLELG